MSNSGEGMVQMWSVGCLERPLLSSAQGLEEKQPDLLCSRHPLSRCLGKARRRKECEKENEMDWSGAKWGWEVRKKVTVSRRVTRGGRRWEEVPFSPQDAGR